MKFHSFSIWRRKIFLVWTDPFHILANRKCPLKSDWSVSPGFYVKLQRYDYADPAFAPVISSSLLPPMNVLRITLFGSVSLSFFLLFPEPKRPLISFIGSYKQLMFTQTFRSAATSLSTLQYLKTICGGVFTTHFCFTFTFLQISPVVLPGP